MDTTKEISRVANKNRLDDVDGPGSSRSKHLGGARSAATIAATLAKERGVPIEECSLDTFYILHRQNGVCTLMRSHAGWVEEIDRLYAERTRPLPDGTIREVNKNQIYLEVAYDKEKGRTLELGAMFRGSSSAGGSSCSSAYTPEVVKLRQQMEMLQKKANSACSEADGLRAQVLTLEEEQAAYRKKVDGILSLMDSY